MEHTLDGKVQSGRYYAYLIENYAIPMAGTHFWFGLVVTVVHHHLQVMCGN